MRGHEKLIELRRQGLRPSGLVHLHDYPVRPVFLDWATGGGAPAICTHGDSIDLLDLRFVVGLQVNVDGENAGRVKALAGACKRAGAEVVFAVCGDKAAMWKKGDAKWLSF